MASQAFVAGTAVLCSLFARHFEWPTPRWAALLLVPVLVLFLGMFAISAPAFSHPFMFGGWWCWPLSMLAAYWTLHRDESEVAVPIQVALHTLALWLITVVLTLEVQWQVAHQVRESTAWALAMFGLVPALVLLLVLRNRDSSKWPLAAHWAAYGSAGAGGIALYLVGWVLYMVFASDGTAAPLPYVPLLNPVDGLQALALFAIVYFLMVQRRDDRVALPLEAWQAKYAAVALAVFAWLNAMLLRTLAHYAGVPYQLEAIARSTLAQTAITIFWTVLALAVMAWANRKLRRVAWIVGAALLVVVVAKLFMIDLSRVGTVPRIVSFLGVGVLMLVIGYFSPLPPKHAEARA